MPSLEAASLCKFILAVGAASGIGEMTSRKFVAEGASVVIADIDLSAAEKLADELNGSSGKVALAVR